jgi:hypothetical protein
VVDPDRVRVGDDGAEQSVAVRQRTDAGGCFLGDADMDEALETACSAVGHARVCVLGYDAKRAVTRPNEFSCRLDDVAKDEVK